MGEPDVCRRRRGSPGAFVGAGSEVVLEPPGSVPSMGPGLGRRRMRGEDGTSNEYVDLKETEEGELASALVVVGGVEVILLSSSFSSSFISIQRMASGFSR